MSLESTPTDAPRAPQRTSQHMEKGKLPPSSLNTQGPQCPPVQDLASGHRKIRTKTVLASCPFSLTQLSKRPRPPLLLSFSKATSRNRVRRTVIVPQRPPSLIWPGNCTSHRSWSFRTRQSLSHSSLAEAKNDNDRIKVEG